MCYKKKLWTKTVSMSQLLLMSTVKAFHLHLVDVRAPRVQMKTSKKKKQTKKDKNSDSQQLIKLKTNVKDERGEVWYYC